MKLDDLDVTPPDGDGMAYDPANPVALLEKAIADAGNDDELAEAVGEAIRSIAAAGADAVALDRARAFVKRKKLLSSIGTFDAIVRELRGGETDRGEAASAATVLVAAGAGALHLRDQLDRGAVRPAPGRAQGRGHAARRQDLAAGAAGARVLHQDRPGRRSAGASRRAAGHRGHRPGRGRVHGSTCAPPSTTATLWLDLGDHTGRAVRITGGRLDSRGLCAGPVQADRADRRRCPSPSAAATSPGPVDVAERRRGRPAAGRRRAGRRAVQRAAARRCWPSSASTGPARPPRSRSSSSLLDPGPVPVRKPPRDADSWVTAAAGSWVVGARQPLRHPAVAVRLAVPRLDRRRRRAPQALHRRRLRGVRVPPLHHLRRDRRRRPGSPTSPTARVPITLDADPRRATALDEETFWAQWSARRTRKLLGARARPRRAR